MVGECRWSAMDGFGGEGVGDRWMSVCVRQMEMGGSAMDCGVYVGDRGDGYIDGCLGEGWE